MSIRKTFIGMALATSALVVHANNLVVNGSFEETAAGQSQGPGTIGSYFSIPGWTSNSAWMGAPIMISNNMYGVAEEGSSFLDLNFNSEISQTITGNGSYILSFWYSPHEGASVGYTGIDFSVGNLNGQVLANAVGAPSGNMWQQYTTSVELNGPTTLRFFSTAGTGGGTLDNVSITSAVPEPDSFAMVFAGLAVIGAIIRRRKRAAA